MAPILDRFIHIIEKNSFNPEDIDMVEITPHAIGLNKMWTANDLQTEEDFGFHGPYLVACAAHRIKSIDYQNADVRRDPKIREFMKKVRMLPNYHEEFGPSMLEDPITRVVSVEISAKGRKFKETSKYIDWSWRPEEVRASDDDLVNKFNEIASGSLASRKIKKATAALLKLEGVESISSLIELLMP